MARITYGLITDIRGSIGGLTFQKNASGAIVRLKSTRVINPSNLLANQQRLLASIVALWFTLTNDQKNAWNALAAAHPFIDGWNVSKQLNGYQNFLSNNLNLASAGLPPISDAPAYALPDPAPTFTIGFSSGKITLNFSAPVDPATPKMLLYASPPVTTSNINTRQAKFIIPSGSWDSSQILDITDSYCNYFSVELAALLLNSNCNICIRVKLIDPFTGFSSVYTSTISRVEAPSSYLTFTFDSLENLAWIIPDYTNVAAWNTLLNLPGSGNPFTSVVVDGLNIKLYGGSDIAMDYHGFEESDGWLSIDDPDGLITSLGEDKFQAGYLTYLNLPGLTQIPYRGLADLGDLATLLLPNVTEVLGYGLNNLGSMASLSLPKCTSIGANGCEWMSHCATFDLPLCTSIGDYCFNRTNFNKTINLPVCTALGSTVGNNHVFDYCSGKTIYLEIPAALMTCNGGNPDGDIVALQAVNTVHITNPPV